jgi:hypothetical protein
MKKLIALCFSLLLMVSLSSLPAQIPTIDIDNNPDKDGRVFVDGIAFGARWVGCTSTGGSCTATVVVEADSLEG